MHYSRNTLKFVPVNNRSPKVYSILYVHFNENFPIYGN